uniref:Uncharacterized protein n=1 Tax=Cacopsylla melanoneura TaxID=428564 RepID=A0A8D8X2F3_9HEMI
MPITYLSLNKFFIKSNTYTIFQPIIHHVPLYSIDLVLFPCRMAPPRLWPSLGPPTTSSWRYAVPTESSTCLTTKGRGRTSFLPNQQIPGTAGKVMWLKDCHFHPTPPSWQWLNPTVSFSFTN